MDSGRLSSAQYQTMKLRCQDSVKITKLADKAKISFALETITSI